MTITFIDPAEEAKIMAYHHGVERARLTSSPRPRDPEDVLGETPTPITRERVQSPLISEAEADAEVQFDLAEAAMLGVL